MQALKSKIADMLHSDSATEASRQTILITGASGFVAAHVVSAFLAAGYKVRGTVRSDSSVHKVIKAHQKYANQLSFAIVKDLVADNAFNEAVKNVDGVIHTASPFQLKVEDNVRDLLDPAMKGTENLVKAVQKNAPNVKRVVITSSFGAILHLKEGKWPGHTYSEDDWNPVTFDEARNGDGSTAYNASKTFAEKAAFNYVEHEHPHFSIATICPPMIYGPLEHGVTSTAKLNTSAADIYRLFNGSSSEVPDTAFWAFCDVRNVAQAHLKAYEVPEAGGQRFLTTAGTYSYQMVCDIIRREFPELREKTPEGKEGSGTWGPVYAIDKSKSRKLLGIEYIPLEQTMKDTVRDLLKVEEAEKAGNA